MQNHGRSPAHTRMGKVADSSCVLVDATLTSVATRRCLPVKRCACVFPPLHRPHRPPCSGVREWFRSFATLSDMPREERMRLLKEENAWKNDLVMWMFPDSVRQNMSQFWQTWLRCWILCAAVYFGVGGLWCYYTYFCFGDKLFAPGTIPQAKDILEQMKVGGDMRMHSHTCMHVCMPHAVKGHVSF